MNFQLYFMSLTLTVAIALLPDWLYRSWPNTLLQLLQLAFEIAFTYRRVKNLLCRILQSFECPSTLLRSCKMPVAMPFESAPPYSFKIVRLNWMKQRNGKRTLHYAYISSHSSKWGSYLYLCMFAFSLISLLYIFPRSSVNLPLLSFHLRILSIYMFLLWWL